MFMYLKGYFFFCFETIHIFNILSQQHTNVFAGNVMNSAAQYIQTNTDRQIS